MPVTRGLAPGQQPTLGQRLEQVKVMAPYPPWLHAETCPVRCADIQDHVMRSNRSHVNYRVQAIGLPRG